MNENEEISLEMALNMMLKYKIKAVELGDKLNLSYINVKAISYKDILSKTSVHNDNMLLGIIKRDAIKEDYTEMLKQYNVYKEIAEIKLIEMINTSTTGEAITFFRDKLKWGWNGISKVFNYSVKQCIRLYKKEKMSNNVHD